MKIIKKICNIIFIILSIIALIGFVIIPFFKNEKFNVLLQVTWYLSGAILFINTCLPRKNKKQKSNYTELPKTFTGIFKFIGESFSNVAGLSLIIFLSSMFLINHYELQFYDVPLMIFVLILVIFIGSIYVIYKYRSIFNNFDANQKRNNNIQMLVSMLFYTLVDLLYLFIVKDVIAGQYIVGIIAILIIFYNSTKSFIKNEKPIIFSIVKDVLFGLSITTYLIFIIEDSSLQTIVTSIVSAVFGGYITLLGVAWTIKDNNEKRNADERKSKMPYLYLYKEQTDSTFKSFSPIPDQASNKLYADTKRCVSINDFIVKNSNNSDCIPIGFYINDKIFKFENTSFVERGSIINIITTIRYTLTSDTSSINMFLVIEDTIGNCYKYYCEMECLKSGGTYSYETKDSIKKVPLVEYTVTNIGLPQLINKY